MRGTVLISLFLATIPSGQAKRVKTPKSQNARADAQTHKAHGKHLSKKIKTNRSKPAKHPQTN